MRLGSVALLAIFLSAAPALAVRRIYVANINANTVAVVDAESRSILDVIPVGTQPDGVAVSPDGATVWVANFGDDTVSVIDTATDTVSATIPVGGGPVGIAMRPGGGEVYVANKLDDSISVIDTASRSLAATISIRPDTGVNAVAFTPDGRRALVTASFGEKIRLVDPATRQVLDSVRVGREPNRIAVSPDSTRAYVSLFGVGAGGDPGDPNSLVAVDLATLQIVARAQADKPTGVAVSPDGRFVYVAQRFGVFRHDARTLEVVGAIALPVDVESVAALAEPDVVLLARRQADDLLFVSPGFGFDDSSTAAPPSLPSTGGPFAIAALPAVEPEPLLAAIDAPTFGDKLDLGDSVAARIRVDDGEQQPATWTLTLRADAAPPIERILAAGTTPTAGEVATIEGAGLTAGGSYVLLLDAVSADGAHVVRRVRFTVPDRRYALVPLSPSRIGYEPRFEMDAVGRRFVRWDHSARAFEVIESDTGLRHSVRPLQQFSTITQIVLADDGGRVALNGYLQGSSRAFGMLDLDNLSLSLVPSFPIVIDSDAEARWLVGTQFGNVDDRYQLLDRVDGTRIFISDDEPLRPNPVKCRPELGNRARVNADGTRVAFVTGSDLGFAEADGCTLFAYDRPSDTLRVVTAFGDGSIALPTIDDAGETFGAVLRPDRTDADDGQMRATLIDLASGERTDLLDGDPAASSDAALSGDGRSVAVSSCADLDPSVGNADANNELFRLDLQSGRFTQITDTRGGSVACQLEGGPSYDPLVSAEASVLSFVMQDPTGAGPQRSLRNRFAFGAVRAVPVVEGNTPPKLELEGETTVAIDDPISLLVRSGDRDVDPISFFAQVGDAGLPDGAEFILDRNDPQARFTWYPGPNDGGEHTLRLGTFDGRGGENVQEVTLSVCRRIITRLNPAVVTVAIFGDLPATCGDADANGDGGLSAADLVAVQQADNG